MNKVECGELSLKKPSAKNKQRDNMIEENQHNQNSDQKWDKLDQLLQLPELVNQRQIAMRRKAMGKGYVISRSQERLREPDDEIARVNKADQKNDKRDYEHLPRIFRQSSQENVEDSASARRIARKSRYRSQDKLVDILNTPIRGQGHEHDLFYNSAA